jgi:Ulp1 family protease
MQGSGGVDKLCVPINQDNRHWLFIHMDTRRKRIELNNFKGLNGDSQRYHKSVLRYIYDELRDGFPDTRPDVEVWSTAWILKDNTLTTTAQDNIHDCGIFTFVSMALLVQDIKLTGDTYTQGLIDGRSTRLRLTHHIWKAILRTEHGMPRMNRWIAHTGLPTNSKKTGGDKRATDKGTTSTTKALLASKEKAKTRR